MGKKKTNGMTGEYRYAQQQELINSVARELGCVAFRPNYHGQERDANTVLIYLPEDAEHNRKVDQKPTQYSSKDEAQMYGCTDERYIYRPYFWSFENTDRNGFLTFDFANHGRIDLRDLKWGKRLEGEIKLAYYKKRLAQHFGSGWGFITEADDTLNDMNRNIIEAFYNANQSCFLGCFNGAKDEKNVLHAYDPAVVVRNFEADFIVAKESPELQEEILQWRNTAETGYLYNAQELLIRAGGEIIIWS